MALRLLVMQGCGSDLRDQAQAMRGAFGFDRVNVTKGQAEIDDERQQRKP